MTNPRQIGTKKVPVVSRGVSPGSSGSEVAERVITRYPAYATSPLEEDTRSFSEGETQRSAAATGLGSSSQRVGPPDQLVEQLSGARLEENFGESVSDQLNRMRLIRMRR